MVRLAVFKTPSSGIPESELEFLVERSLSQEEIRRKGRGVKFKVWHQSSCFPHFSSYPRAKVGEQEEKVESRRKRREVKVWHQSTLNWGANKLRPRPRGRAEE